MNFPLGSGFYLAFIYSFIVRDLSEATLNLTGSLVPINILRADPAFYVAAVERSKDGAELCLGWMAYYGLRGFPRFSLLVGISVPSVGRKRAAFCSSA